jgi:hypothetical protein
LLTSSIDNYQTLKEKGSSISAGGNLSSTVLGFNENWNTKLHGPIATKKINKKIGKICFL